MTGLNPPSAWTGSSSDPNDEEFGEVVAELTADRPLHEDIERAEALVAAGLLEEQVQAALEDALA